MGRGWGKFKFGLGGLVGVGSSGWGLGCLGGAKGGGWGLLSNWGCLGYWVGVESRGLGWRVGVWVGSSGGIWVFGVNGFWGRFESGGGLFLRGSMFENCCFWFLCVGWFLPPHKVFFIWTRAKVSGRSFLLRARDWDLFVAFWST